MKKTGLIFFSALSILTGSSFLEKSSIAFPQRASDEQASIADTFPVPPQSGKMMFYLQRTQNINTIVYDLNYNSDSTLNEKEPVHAYWVRYADKGEDKGKAKELSYLQKNYAYGVNVVCIDKIKSTYKVNYVSYKKRDIYLTRSKTGKAYRACLTINNKIAYLDRIFVKIDGGSFWLPHITYVEVTGKDVATGKTVSEKIIP